MIAKSRKYPQIGESMRRNHGADYYCRLGRAGGSAPYTGKKGFASMTHERRKECGTKGGQVSKRGKYLDKETMEYIDIKPARAKSTPKSAPKRILDSLLNMNKRGQL